MGHELWRWRTLLVLQVHRDARLLGLILLPHAGFALDRQRPVAFDDVREAGTHIGRGDAALNQRDGWGQHGEEGLEQVNQSNPRRLGELAPRREALDVVVVRRVVRHVAGLRTDVDACVRLLCAKSRRCCRGTVGRPGSERARGAAAATGVLVGIHTCVVCANRLLGAFVREPAPSPQPAPTYNICRSPAAGNNRPTDDSGRGGRQG